MSTVSAAIVGQGNSAVWRALLAHVRAVPAVRRVFDAGMEQDVQAELRADGVYVVTTNDFSADALPHLPFKDQAFDVVYARDFLERIEFDATLKILEDLARITRGRLVLCFATGLITTAATVARQLYPNGYAHVFSEVMLKGGLTELGFGHFTVLRFNFSDDVIFVGDRC